MADLDKTGIETGETVDAEDITKLYDALIGTTVYDNVPALLGNIKEYTAHLVVVSGANWSQTVLKNTTGSTGVTVGLFDQENQEDLGITFSGYTLPVINKILVYVKMGTDWVAGTEEHVWFVPERKSDTELILKMYKSNFVEFNHAGADLSEDSDLYIRILFYPL